MIYKDFKDIKLSRLGFGNMRLPQDGDGNIDYGKARELIDLAMKGGVNYYDTAWVYHGGQSESFLGEALGSYPRDSYYLATKFFIQADEDYRKVLDTQLAKLRTDHIDFYLIHCLLDGNVHRYLESGAIEYFLRKKEEGVIRYLGFSSHAGSGNLRLFAESHPWDFAQIQLNYFDWLNSDTSEEYTILEERNIPIMVMEPVRGGKLARLCPEAEQLLHDAHPEWSIPSWAMRFAASLPIVQTVLSGMNAVDQVKDNMATFSDSAPFTEEDRDTLLRACKIYSREITIPCTGCRYCCDGCPMEISIPQFLSVYNRSLVDTDFSSEEFKGIDSAGTPPDCIGCAQCTSNCPQGIRIPELLGEISEKFYG